jgi:hypothetical protein
VWEFDPRRAGYLGDVRFFKHELRSGLTDDDDYPGDADGNEEAGDDEDGDEEAGDHDDEHFDNGDVLRDPGYQPADLSEHEAIQLAIAQSKLGQLT